MPQPTDALTWRAPAPGHGARLRLGLAIAILAAGISTLVVGGSALGAAALGRASTSASAGAPSTVEPDAYWLVASDGGIFAFGGVPFEGSTGAIRLRQPIVGMAASSSGEGYWLLGADAGIFAFGDAPFLGSPAGLPAASRPSAPAVGITTTPDGRGYWIATRDGSVYTFGDAGFHGSLAGSSSPTSPFIGMASTTDGGGYWLTTSTGAVHAFGDAAFHGSAAQVQLTKPVVAMSATPDGGGYWLVASDGGIFSFGDARFFGSTGAIHLNQPIVGMSASSTGGGYWLVASDGGIFSFGDALFRGSTGGHHLNQPVTGMAVGRTLNPYRPAAQGYDVSFPQCGGGLPQPLDFGVIGVNDGRAFTENPCLATEGAWSSPSTSLYMNINAPPSGAPQGTTGPAGACTGNHTGCMAYNYGYNAAVDAFAYASREGTAGTVWWLDVETANNWDSNVNNNARTIQGALDALGAEGVVVGIYSTPFQFGRIAGTFQPGVPVWRATGAGLATAQADCSRAFGFGGGAVWLAQYGTAGIPYDQDYACPTQ
jgi:hypothetical protein